MIKYLVHDNCSIIKFNDETTEVNLPNSSREAVRSILMADEPGILVDENGIETPVKTGDIIVRFYERVFPKRTIVVKSKDWKNNIVTYNKHVEEEANKHSLKKCCDDCPCCGDECACDASC